LRKKEEILCGHPRAKTGASAPRNAGSFRSVIVALSNFLPRSKSDSAADRRNLKRSLTSRKSSYAARGRYYAIYLPNSAPGCVDFNSAGKTFHQSDVGVSPSDCVAFKHCLPRNASAPWTQCHFGVHSNPTNARLSWNSSKDCLKRTDDRKPQSRQGQFNLTVFSLSPL
jgi:hypothetical protein